MTSPSTTLPRRIGLIAGAGKLPILVARSATARGYRVVSIALAQEYLEVLAPHSEAAFSYSIGQANKIFRQLRAQQVSEVVIIGRINKQVILSRPRFDLRAIQLLRRLDIKDDDSLMAEIRKEFEKEGLTILEQRAFLQELCPAAGPLTRRLPSAQQWRDIAYGFKLAKQIGQLRIGQTVVVKNQAVLAVEAIEGTDKAIDRGCQLAKRGAVVVKVSRPDQDLSWDLPTVGLETARRLAEGKAFVLAIEAGCTLAVELPSMIELADREGIAIIAVDETNLPPTSKGRSAGRIKE